MRILLVPLLVAFGVIATLAVLATTPETVPAKSTAVDARHR
jgi:hypothetical protein